MDRRTAAQTHQEYVNRLLKSREERDTARALLKESERELQKQWSQLPTLSDEDRESVLSYAQFVALLKKTLKQVEAQVGAKG